MSESVYDQVGDMPKLGLLRCLALALIGKHSPVLTAKQSLSLGVRNAHIAGSVVRAMLIVKC